MVLFPGLPGGPELLVVLLVMILLLGIPAALIVVASVFGLKYFRSGDTRDERIAELEREVQNLRARLEEERSETDADATSHDRSSETGPKD